MSATSKFRTATFTQNIAPLFAKSSCIFLTQILFLLSQVERDKNFEVAGFIFVVSQIFSFRGRAEQHQKSVLKLKGRTFKDVPCCLLHPLVLR
jgi:hypothetical protein